MEVIETTLAVAHRYADVQAALRRAGTPIAMNDIWIAAAALIVDGDVLTFDDDFRRVNGLRCTVLSRP